jgi:hypothetical protein
METSSMTKLVMLSLDPAKHNRERAKANLEQRTANGDIEGTANSLL